MLIQAMGEFSMCYQDVKAFLTLEKNATVQSAQYSDTESDFNQRCNVM